jgi:ADP-ribosylglycohydrolase
MQNGLTDRILGCILGGAIGDCLGNPHEGHHPPILSDTSANWVLSDDTQLVLATCAAIVATGGVDPRTIAAYFADGFKRSRFTGLGGSTFKALSELAAGAHWALAGRKGEFAAGNGAAMRIAPLAFCLDPADPLARRTIRDVSRITHHHEEAYAGALALTTAIRAAASSHWKGGPGLLSLVIRQLPDTSVRDRLVQISKLESGSTVSEVAEQFGSSGYVLESVPLAVYAASQFGEATFQEVLQGVVQCGGDTDTNASMTGQILGTLIGRSGIPESMLERLFAGFSGNVERRTQVRRSRTSV